MDKINITLAAYMIDNYTGELACIAATIDGIQMSVPLDPANSHYAGIVASTATDGSFWGDTVPEPMATEAATWLFNQQLADYKIASERLAQYIVAEGRTSVIKNILTLENVMEDVEILSSIDPVVATIDRLVFAYDPMVEPTMETIENPLITTDVSERDTAQAVVDATPQPVKDAA